MRNPANEVPISERELVLTRNAHVKMGFHEGWGKATDQLTKLVLTL